MSNCTGQYKAFHAGETCQTNSCGFGGCCLNGSCSSNYTESACLNAGGGFLSGGCQSNSCSISPRGACCGGGSCGEDVLESSCANGGGTFYEDQSCAEAGCTSGNNGGSSGNGGGSSAVCCSPEGSCVDIASGGSCSSGQVKISDTQCSNNPCGQPTACCINNGCASYTASYCSQIGGTSFSNESCEDALDRPECAPTGACCGIDDVQGACSEAVTYAKCEDDGGVWVPATTCDDAAEGKNNAPPICDEEEEDIPQCGDGVVQKGEQCDTGIQKTTDEYASLSQVYEGTDYFFFNESRLLNVCDPRTCTLLNNCTLSGRVPPLSENEETPKTIDIWQGPDKDKLSPTVDPDCYGITTDVDDTSGEECAINAMILGLPPIAFCPFNGERTQRAVDEDDQSWLLNPKDPRFQNPSASMMQTQIAAETDDGGAIRTFFRKILAFFGIVQENTQTMTAQLLAAANPPCFDGGADCPDFYCLKGSSLGKYCTQQFCWNPEKKVEWRFPVTMCGTNDTCRQPNNVKCYRSGNCLSGYCAADKDGVPVRVDDDDRKPVAPVKAGDPLGHFEDILSYLITPIQQGDVMRTASKFTRGGKTYKLQDGKVMAGNDTDGYTEEYPSTYPLYGTCKACTKDADCAYAGVFKDGCDVPTGQCYFLNGSKQKVFYQVENEYTSSTCGYYDVHGHAYVKVSYLNPELPDSYRQITKENDKGQIVTADIPYKIASNVPTSAFVYVQSVLERDAYPQPPKAPSFLQPKTKAADGETDLGYDLRDGCWAECGGGNVALPVFPGTVASGRSAQRHLACVPVPCFGPPAGRYGMQMMTVNGRGVDAVICENSCNALPINGLQGGQQFPRNQLASGHNAAGGTSGGSGGGNETEHLTCVNEQCKKVDGAGQNGCAKDQDCAGKGKGKHTACQNQKCVEVSGAGQNGCSGNAQCATQSNAGNNGGNTGNNGGNTGANGGASGSDTGGGAGGGDQHLACFSSQCVLQDGVGSDQCADDVDCGGSGNDHLECQNLQCVVVTGTVSDQCGSDADCGGGEKHLECFNSQCVLQDGAGSDQCDDDQDCGGSENEHLECQNDQCIVAQGAGPDSCVDADDCGNGTKYLACSNTQCVLLDGIGNDECLLNADCGGSNDEHLVCQSNQCVLVSGAGTNQCAINSDCGGDQKHLECFNTSCALVDGGGPDQCQNNEECGGSNDQHLECQDLRCVVLPGAGADRCTSNSDCGGQGSSSSGSAGSATSGRSGSAGSGTSGSAQSGASNRSGASQSGASNRSGVSQSGASRSGASQSGASNSSGQSGSSRSGSAGSEDSSVSSVRSLCGDFRLGSGEECDQGTGNSDTLPDRCRTDCTLPFCGDGVQDSREECDDGNNRDDDGCSSTCQPEITIIAKCGDGIVDRGERCDDGNTINNDDCSNSCRPPTDVASLPICGNGVKEPNEECDDGNAVNTDGCSDACTLEEGRCGDSILQKGLGEQCEPSLHDRSLSYGCSSRCRYVSLLCGNSAVDVGEECDQGPRNSDQPNASCRTDCSLPRCGDSVIDSGEQCDDGNRLNNDGCSYVCRFDRNTRAIAFPGDGYGNLQADILNGRNPNDIGFGPNGFGRIQPITSAPGTAQTGPAALFAMAGGAAAGVGWMRRRRK